jgi:hypothetical protein
VAPSGKFVPGMLTRTAGLLTAGHDRIATLITLAYAVCCDEIPLKVGPRTPNRVRRRPSGTCWGSAPSSTPTPCSGEEVPAMRERYPELPQLRMDEDANEDLSAYEDGRKSASVAFCPIREHRARIESGVP